MHFDSAIDELKSAFTARHLWMLLGWQDIKQRYRRSIIGPFWLTISTGMLIGALGFLWSSLFKMTIQEYLPFFAIGFVTWTFISGQLSDCCLGFVQFEAIIKQVRLPLPSFILRLLWRNLIIFLHNFLIIVIVVSFGPGWHPGALTALVGVLLISAFCLSLGLIIAIVCTRYRDFPQIIQSFLQIIFFATPIIWQPDSIGDRGWIAQFNPLYHLIETIRAPLLGSEVALTSWHWSLGALAVSSVVAFLLFAKFRGRIAYWL